MRILHIVDIKNPKGNGVAIAVENYLKYESQKENVALYNLGTDVKIDGVQTFLISKYNKLSLLPDNFDKPDLIIFNEVYKIKYTSLYKECLKRKIPYVVIPHGCLVKKAQSKKKLKKIIANLLLFNRFLRKASLIQFLNEEEMKNSKKVNKNYIISGNGVAKINRQNEYKNKDFIYIGRYDIKVKGLDLLVNMCLKNKTWFLENNVKIKLYGRTAGNGYLELKNIINKNNLEKVILLNDAVYGKEKEKILSDSYCFIQVSRHEGQPMGIMEALGYGLPCIVTYGTTFGNYVNEKKCGIGINFSSEELFVAIQKLYTDVELRNSFHENSKCIYNDYGWDENISKLLKEYSKVAKR